MKRYLLLLPAFFIIFCFNSCKKDPPASNDAQVKNEITALKEEFISHNYSTKLRQKNGDSLELNLVPRWDSAYRKNNIDSIIYYFIPLQPQLRNRSGKHLYLSEINNRQFLLVRKTPKGNEFTKAVYTRKIIKSISDWDFVNNFTGTLKIESYNTGKAFVYEYINGNILKHPNPGKATTEGYIQQCHTEYECHWGALCPATYAYNGNIM
ncbi:hypothetical protein HGH93_14075 [Chitinophaga polysaccharea]|uniref:hypothetical protein n=1 Tax=Chitinophaga TaxID=79328 RepID=UPI0014559236|nr:MULTISPECIES: hypothetical protein [Chitinophaga]NLR59239.1 hypothetical protein [Chitinophaga polysaccharea]NLU91992.1 hypothetical protein [Chitinophaga sp. Ak27]